jgi:hypothetical protein
VSSGGGVGRLAQLAERRIDRHVEIVKVRELVPIRIEAGLAPTDLQVAIYDAEGLGGYADFGWLPLMVLGEFDGRQKYGEGSDSADVLWREKRREDRFRALGFEVVRWTWADLLDPALFTARLRAALARAQARGAVSA